MIIFRDQNYIAFMQYSKILIFAVVKVLHIMHWKAQIQNLHGNLSWFKVLNPFVA